MLGGALDRHFSSWYGWLIWRKRWGFRDDVRSRYRYLALWTGGWSLLGGALPAGAAHALTSKLGASRQVGSPRRESLAWAAAAAAALPSTVLLADFFARHHYAAFGFGAAPHSVRSLADLPGKARDDVVRFVHVSDTHNGADEMGMLPQGDVLIHSGDFSKNGTEAELVQFNAWLGRQTQFKRRIVIAGNHDLCLDKDTDALTWAQFVEPWLIGTGLPSVKHKATAAARCRTLLTNCEYLAAEEATPERGLRIWGAPYSPTIAPPGIYVPWAFNRDPAAKKAAAQPGPFVNIPGIKHVPQLPLSLTDAVPSAEDEWSKIPEGIDILITHGPPKGKCDMAWGRHGGDAVLLEHVRRVKPQFHLFGHVHESYGAVREGETTFVNGSSFTALDEPRHAPVVIDVKAKAQ